MNYKILFSILIFCLPVLAFAQGGEEEGPIFGNPDLWNGQGPKVLKIGDTFDSTFVYFPDQISLPFVDDFSSDKFQKYNAGYTDPNVTSEIYFSLLDPNTSNPLHADSVFSTEPTYRRYVSLADGTFSDTTFPPTSYSYNNLASYPVNYSNNNFYPPFILIDTIDYPNPIDTIFMTDKIVSQNSARIFLVQVNNPDKIWLESRAYHNYRFARDPWSLGVATFDGLDENGYPYSFGSNGSSVADVLTSKPIEMSGLSVADNVYLSFMFQKEGLGEIPEDEDSLILELFNPITQNWNYAWSVNGGGVADFLTGHVHVNNQEYLNDGFQFRFKSYGSLAGGLDHFHLDYVRLRDNSNSGDTLIEDFAQVYPVMSLLKEFESVPWDHYKNSPANRMNDKLDISVRNSSAGAKNNKDGSLTVLHNGSQEGAYVLNRQTLSGGSINYAPRTTYFSKHDLSGGYRFDESKTGTKQTFKIEAVAEPQVGFGISQNDSSFYEQYFGNYYAYDDGTAERAYGPTGSQARLAIQYTPYEADSVIGAMIHFVPSVVDVSNKLFLLTVWADAGGVPGEVLYEDDLFDPRKPIFEVARNKFYPYYFSNLSKIPVNGTFYIGWRQFDAERLNVGIDKNKDNSNHTFYSTNGGNTWFQSSIPGSVMIRPIFSTAMDAELGLRVVSQEATSPSFEVYPNPSSDFINLRATDGNTGGRIQIFSTQGKLVISTNENKIDISTLHNGVYIVKIDGSSSVRRIVKK
jgi:hypothetical protein